LSINHTKNAGKVIDARADLKSVAARYVPGVSLDKSVRLEFTQEGLILNDYHFEYAGKDVIYLFSIYDTLS
jgi:ribonuclease D